MKTVKINDIRLKMDSNIISDNIIKAIEAGYYEKEESHLLPSIIQKGERILEIGGGLGFISTMAANHPNTKEILVYEANPILCDYIKQTFKTNKVKNGAVKNGILSNNMKDKTKNFYLRSDFWASSLSPGPFGYDKVAEIEVVNVNQVIIDFQPSMIICDIEGGEIDLFRNINLENVSKVFMEIHQNATGRQSIIDLFNYLHSRGFHYDQWHSSGSVILFSHVNRK